MNEGEALRAMWCEQPALADDILSHFRRHVENHPNKNFIQLALPGNTDNVTYARGHRDIEYCRLEFERAGVARGAVVLLFLPQSWRAIAYYFGAIAYGCIASFMPCPSSKQDSDKYWAAHHRLISRTRPAALVTDGAHAEAIARNGLVGDSVVLVIVAELIGDATMSRASAAWPDVAPTPVLQHSSGTTGMKKGVILSNAAILNQISAYASAIGARQDDVVVSWLPLYHDMGLLACLLMPAILGQTIVLLDPFHWVMRPATLLQAISLYRGTLCWLPNFAFDHLTRSVDVGTMAGGLDSMRAFINCSEPCHWETLQRFHAKFGAVGLAPRALQLCYAMAETTFAVTQSDLDRAPQVITVDRTTLHQQGAVIMTNDSESGLKVISVGRPIKGTEITIRGGDGGLLPDGVLGEICVRSASLFSGYYKLPDETKSRFSNGVYATRDRGFTLSGELFVLGRLDDLIIVAGRNFHATEIESLLADVSGLKPGRAIAFGITNTERGTADLVIVAELSQDATVADEIAGRRLKRDVREAVFQTLGVYPAEVLLVAQNWLHKTTSGKIERAANVERFLREKGDQTIGASTHA